MAQPLIVCRPLPKIKITLSPDAPLKVLAVTNKMAFVETVTSGTLAMYIVLVKAETTVCRNSVIMPGLEGFHLPA